MSDEEAKAAKRDKASSAAIGLSKAMNDALEGNFDWERLAAKVHQAVEVGCANPKDLKDIESRSLVVSRVKEIFQCMEGKGVEGMKCKRTRF